MYLFKYDEIKTIDAEIIRNGFPAMILMENAGTAFIEVIRRTIGAISHKSFLVCCGPGNNGADGLVVARKLLCEGAFVTVLIPSSRTIPSQDDWYQQFQRLSLFSTSKLRIVNMEDVDLLSTDSVAYDLIIDALFGIGLNRPLTGPYLQVAEWINQSGVMIGSVDVPSGLIINADFTVIFGLLKINIGINGYAHFGQLYFSSLSVPFHHYVSSAMINSPVPLLSRAVDGHKGSFGQGLFIGGAANYYGAPYFNAMSFLLAGGGYSRLAVPHSLIPTIASKGPEIVFVPMDESIDGSILSAEVKTVTPLLPSQQIIAIGSGLSLRQSAVDFFFSFLREKINVPLIIDGDGLTILSLQPDYLTRPRQHPLILTPHIGEMSKLTNLPINEIKDNPFKIAETYSHQWNAIVVLKDARTIIAAPDGRTWCNISGNDGLATPGTGDVLVGLMAAICCQNLPLIDGVRTAVFLHGLSADLAVADIGKDGLTATKLMNTIPSALQKFRGSPEELMSYRLTILP